MTKICYNKDLLQEVCNRDTCIIDFDKIEKYNREIKVDFICNCGCEYNRTFRSLYKIGAFCEKCGINKRRGNCLTKEISENICSRDKCIIIFDKLEKCNRDTKIKFICNCGIEYSKTFRLLYDIGAFCKICTKNKRYEKVKQNSIEKYGVEHPQQYQEAKDKSKQTCIERYGVECPMKSQEVKDKSKQTCIERYGAMKSQEAKDKSKQTCLNKYGVKYAFQSQEVKDKMKTTCIERYGVEYAFQSQEAKDKFKQTCIERYGVEHISQYAEISEKQSKNAYKLKEFNFPYGNTIEVQGYEPLLLKNLVEEGYIYEDIITKRTDVPVIWYEKNNKQHRYYCDVYIPKINTIYEVKSTWTYKKDIEDIPFKKQACIDTGYLFELYVYDGKGIRQEI
jgi:hypothetical protein